MLHFAACGSVERRLWQPADGAGTTTTEISREKLPEGFEESRVVAQQGGTIAGNTRKEIEEKTGKPIVTSQKAKRLKGMNVL